jgi:hypothetical protein
MGGGQVGDGGDEARARKAMEAYRFDSTALERAARAARELEKSRKYIFFFPIIYKPFYVSFITIVLIWLSR